VLGYCCFPDLLDEEGVFGAVIGDLDLRANLAQVQIPKVGGTVGGRWRVPLAGDSCNRIDSFAFLARG